MGPPLRGGRVENTTVPHRAERNRTPHRPGHEDQAELLRKKALGVGMMRQKTVPTVALSAEPAAVARANAISHARAQLLAVTKCPVAERCGQGEEERRFHDQLQG